MGTITVDRANQGNPPGSSTGAERDSQAWTRGGAVFEILTLLREEELALLADLEGNAVTAELAIPIIPVPVPIY